MEKIGISSLDDRFFSSPNTKHLFHKDSYVLAAPKDLASDLLRLQINATPDPRWPVSFEIGEIIHRVAITVHVFHGNIKMGAGLRGGFSIALYQNAEFRVGDATTISGSVTVSADRGCRVELGEDCMFSGGIELQSGDMHRIISLDDHTLLNDEASSIELGDHCWVGRGAFIGASGKALTVGKSAIIGARSVVVGSVPRNSLVVGVPAKVIKSDVTWSRSSAPTADEIARTAELYGN